MFSKKSFLAILVSLVFTFPLYSFSVTDSEAYVKDMKDLSTFKKLYISAGSMEITLDQGPKTEVRLEGDKDLIDQLDVKVMQGELEIIFKNKQTKTSKSGTIKAHITTNSLTTITTKGSVKIQSDKPWKAPSLSFLLTGSGSVNMPINVKWLSVQISGSSDLELKGSAQSQDIAVTGSGEYNGKNLKSDIATVVLSGSGSASVFVKKTLTATIYGSGNIQYKGTPQIESNIYGSGRVEKLEDL